MLDVLRSRRGLVASAAIVILCILGFFLATAPTWRNLVGGGSKLAGSVDSGAAKGVSVAGNGTVSSQSTSVPAGSASKSGSAGVVAPRNADAPSPDGTFASDPAKVASRDAPSVSLNSAGPATPGPTTSMPADAAPPSTAGKQGSAPEQPQAPTSPALPSSSTADSPKITVQTGQTGTPAANRPPSTASVSRESQGSVEQPGTAPDVASGLASAGRSSDGTGGLAARGAATGNGPPNVATGSQPSFDIVRIEPSGDSVIAARGTPNADIDLLDGSTVIAHARTDANGQVAFLPPPLKAGEHSLALAITPPGGTRVVSAQSVAVSVPNEPKTAPMVALIQPNQPAAILSGPVAGNTGVTSPATDAAAASATRAGSPASPEAAGRKAASSAPLAVRSVEVETMGSFYASGRAQPDSKTRVYLNGAYVASVTADPNGVWSLRISRGMTPGHYQVRADQLGPDGQVTARVEVPFDYPAQVAASRPDDGKKNTVVASSTASAPAILGQQAPANTADTSGAGVKQGMGAALDPSGLARTNASTASPPPPARSAQASAALQVPPRSPAPAQRSDDVARSDVPAAAGALSATRSQAAMDPEKAVTAAPPSPRAAETPQPNADQTAAGTASPRLATAQPASPTGASSHDAGRSPPSTDVPASGASSPAAALTGPPSPANPQDLATLESETPTVVAELVTAKVVHGDSLWRISRSMLGHGIRYTQIYAANTQQIRDPRLIFPGQVFVLPQD